MYILYPKGLNYKGYITNNTVSGKITFFEDNKNRRAYCKAYVGEIMNWTFTNKGNQSDFKKNEIFEYSVDLRPDMCEDAVYTETVTEAGCDTFGYTTFKCEGCGYACTDHYTLPRHTVEEWTVTTEPTVQNTGIKTGACVLCGTVLTEIVEKLEPPAETPIPEETADPGKISASDELSESGENQADEGDAPADSAMSVFKNPVALSAAAVLALAILSAGIIVFSRNRDKKQTD